MGSTGQSGSDGKGQTGTGDSLKFDQLEWKPMIIGSSSVGGDTMLESEELGERPMVVITPQLGSLADSTSNDGLDYESPMDSMSESMDDSNEVEWPNVIESAPPVGLQTSQKMSGINIVSSLHEGPEEAAQGEEGEGEIDSTPQQLLNAALQHFGVPEGMQTDMDQAAARQAALKAAATIMPGMSQAPLAPIGTPPASLGTPVSAPGTPLSAGRSPLSTRRTPMSGVGSSSDQPLELSDDSDDEIPTSFIRIPQLSGPLPTVNPNPPLPLGKSSSQLPYPLPTVQPSHGLSAVRPGPKKKPPKEISMEEEKAKEARRPLRGGHGKSLDAHSNRLLLTGEQRLAIAQYVEMTGFSHKDVAENFAKQWNINIVPSTVYRALKKYTTLKAAGKEPTAKNMASVSNEYQETDKLAMALYASKHGATEAARVFSEKLGFCINESTVRGFVKKNLGKMKLQFLEDQPIDQTE